MALEIERKFLVVDDAWRAQADAGRRMRQGYLTSSALNSVRVRIVDDGAAELAIKSGYRGLTRDEFEYQVPVADAVAMLPLCTGSIVDKVRHHLQLGGHTWEIDVFSGDNAGLIIAEVELASETEAVPLPPWTGEEVTGQLRYQNSQLAIEPYGTWVPGDR
jgi:adenylate cyclase